MNFNKNDTVIVTIEDMGTEGEGIGKVEGFPLFVKDAIIGDTVEAKIVKNKKNYAYARLEKVLSPSPFRVQPVCRFHRQCGGCQLQAMSYERQLIFKQDKVKNNLLRIGGFSQSEIDRVMEPIVGMEEPFRYRNKAQYPSAKTRTEILWRVFTQEELTPLLPIRTVLWEEKKIRKYWTRFLPICGNFMCAPTMKKAEKG